VTANGANGQISDLDYLEILPIQKSFDAIAAYINGSTVNVTINGHPQRYTGAYTTDNFLHVLGVTPTMGRDFTPADNKEGAEKVAIIGYGIWKHDFGGSGDVVGKVVRINGKPATIIGVMPEGFAFPTNEELWIPLFSEFPPKPRGDPTAVNPAMLGVLKTGVSIDQANAEFSGIAKRLAETYPASNKQFSAAQVQPFIVQFVGTQLKFILYTMLAFCVGVLFIACANVMNMQFARATLRAKELVIRSSLGANRMRLVRQMLTESLLLSSIGALAGIALAYEAIHWLTVTLRSMENPPPSWMTFDLEPRVLAITVAATAFAAVVSGLLPALSSSRANAADVLRDSGRGNTSRRMSVLSRSLVVFQIVITCILLIGSLLELRSILKQQSLDFGYDAGAMLTARMGLMDGDYPSQDARKTFYDQLIEQLRADPQFTSVALTNRFRMMFGGGGPIEVDGTKYGDARRPNVSFEQVTGDYFGVTGQKLTEGRTFTDQDSDARDPIAIVNAEFVKHFLPDGSPIGRRFRTVNPGNATQPPGPWRTIVGVVSTIRMSGPFANGNPVGESGFYVPYYAQPFGPLQTAPAISQFATVILRPRAGSAELAAPELRRIIGKLDPNLPLYFVGTPKTQLEAFVAQNRVVAMMFTIFGVVAVVLASVGIYGLMSFAVNQRTQEFGVRMALGADRRRILRIVLRSSVTQIAIGLVLGLGLAYALARLGGSAVQQALFNVDPAAPDVYFAVGGLIAFVAIAATFWPARRATRVHPIVALRAD
jgi:predicted permease